MYTSIGRISFDAHEYIWTLSNGQKASIPGSSDARHDEQPCQVPTWAAAVNALHALPSSVLLLLCALTCFVVALLKRWSLPGWHQYTVQCKHLSISWLRMLAVRKSLLGNFFSHCQAVRAGVQL